MRGVRNACGLYLIFSSAGLLQLNVEDTLAGQQPTQIASSNSTEALNGGWPAYEFGDNAFSGIARMINGEASLTVSSRDAADSPNRYTVEFQDQFNQYQQDSLSLVDVADSQLFGQDVVTSLAALGLPNLDQAVRAAALQLYKSVDGNTYVEFDTSVKAVGLRPGAPDHTYLRERRIHAPTIPDHRDITKPQLSDCYHHGADSQRRVVYGGECRSGRAGTAAEFPGWSAAAADWQCP